MDKISNEQIQKLRAKTGASITYIKKALEEAAGNEEEALKVLKKKGESIAEQKSARQTKSGIVSAYIHTNNKVGVLVALKSETDFVAKNEEFKKLAHELALQVAAANPKYLSPDDVPPEVIDEEKEIFREQAKTTGKSDDIIEKIIEGKMQSRFSEICLLNQPYIRDEDKTIESLIKEYVAKLGENIEVADFYRLEI
jgi:elongation factor Ts